jgi:hypothetical protein
MFMFPLVVLVDSTNQYIYNVHISSLTEGLEPYVLWWYTSDEI